jgi:hypothetical protein
MLFEARIMVFMVQMRKRGVLIKFWDNIWNILDKFPVLYDY